MIVVTLVVIFFLFSIFSIYVRRFANQRHPNPPPSERPSSPSAAASTPLTKGVNRTIVRSLPVYVYRCDAKYQIDCAICLSEYEEEERVKMIPSCQHVFHPECIDTWLFSHVSCPVCRSTRFFEEKGSVDGVGLGGDCQTVSEYGGGGGGSTVAHSDTCVEVGTRGMRRISSVPTLPGELP